jgi:putative ABC transport system permease protein
MARRYWPNEDPIGKRFTFGDPAPDSQWITIVGVVRDVKRQGLDAPVRIDSYMPHSQMSERTMRVVVRTSVDPLSLAKNLRDTVWSLDKDIPIADIKTMDDILADTMASRRFNLLLMGIFASVGLYGVMSYSVTQRTHEIGIRIALGARKSDVLKLVVGQGMIMTLIDVVVGLAASFGLTRLMSSLLYGVSAADPLTFAAISILIALVSFGACYIPANRAAKVDPMVALRYE